MSGNRGRREEESEVRGALRGSPDGERSLLGAREASVEAAVEPRLSELREDERCNLRRSRLARLRMVLIPGLEGRVAAGGAGIREDGDGRVSISMGDRVEGRASSVSCGEGGPTVSSG